MGIDYLAIGHLTVDHNTRSGSRSYSSMGGSAAYASWTAARLGLRAGVATAAGEEMDWDRLLPGVEIIRHCVPAATTFHNLYEDRRRSQWLLEMALPLSPCLVPATWQDCPIIHLAPVVHEVGAAFLDLFPGALVGLTPQGLLREWDRDGRVQQGRWSGEHQLLDGAEVAIFSEEDLAGHLDFLALCLERVPLVLLTRGSRGATVFVDRLPTQLPAFPVEEVDPTGAGDVFAAAFLIEYHRTADPHHSAAFACCAASFAVQQPGLSGISTRRDVEERLDSYRALL